MPRVKGLWAWIGFGVLDFDCLGFRGLGFRVKELLNILKNRKGVVDVVLNNSQVEFTAFGAEGLGMQGFRGVGAQSFGFRG